MRLSNNLVNGFVGTIFALLMMIPVQANEAYALPKFTQTSTQEWLNSKPLTKRDLLGKVTLIDF